MNYFIAFIVIYFITVIVHAIYRSRKHARHIIAFDIEVTPAMMHYSDGSMEPFTIKWRRYRFKTKSVADWRPLIHNPMYPYWCSGYGGGGFEEFEYAIIVAYLPDTERLEKYWDDAYDVDFDECDNIIFSSRFPKSDNFIESNPPSITIK